VLDPRGLYDITGALPPGSRPVLVIALTGFVDAGGATRLAAEHLLSTLDAEPMVEFDVDQLLDYRSRRPPMLFVEDHWEDYERPLLVMQMLRDEGGTPFLLLTGPEPDLQWERFAVAVRMLVDELDIRLSIGLNAIPMAVPHTRPSGVTAHASRRELIAGYEPWLQRVQVPGSAAHLIEYELGRAGRDAMGFAVHVPHYLAQTEYPTAAETLIASIARATGLHLPTEELQSAAAQVVADVDEQIAKSAEVAAVVQALEQQYDAYIRGRGNSLLATDTGPLPTAEELGAELERFLADRERRGDPPDR
jgi:predicted ATP-grasp superfamily ATP-dependent carboligase